MSVAFSLLESILHFSLRPNQVNPGLHKLRLHTVFVCIKYLLYNTFKYWGIYSLKSNMIISHSIQTSTFYVLTKHKSMISTSQSEHIQRHLVVNRWRLCWELSTFLVHSCCHSSWPYLPYPCGSLAFFDSSFPFVLLMWYKVLARLWSWHVPSWQPRWGARRGRNFTAMLPMMKRRNYSSGF